MYKYYFKVYGLSAVPSPPATRVPGFSDTAERTSNEAYS